MKPVWRMNTGNEVPSDLGDKIMHEGLEVEIETTERLKHPLVWMKYGDGNNVIAYQTNRTKEAKYKRVECEGCDGLGFATDFNGGEVTIYEDETCPDCNGKGYQLERIK